MQNMIEKMRNYEYYGCIKCGGYVVLPKGLSYDNEDDRQKMVCGLCELEEMGEGWDYEQTRADREDS